jgi:hypothetical protein
VLANENVPNYSVVMKLQPKRQLNAALEMLNVLPKKLVKLQIVRLLDVNASLSLNPDL